MPYHAVVGPTMDTLTHACQRSLHMLNQAQFNNRQHMMCDKPLLALVSLTLAYDVFIMGIDGFADSCLNPRGPPLPATTLCQLAGGKAKRLWSKIPALRVHVRTLSVD